MPPEPRTPALRGPHQLTLEDVAYVFDRMGGLEGLVKFARRTPASQRLFWSTLLPMLLTLAAGRDDEAGKRMAALAATWLPSK